MKKSLRAAGVSVSLCVLAGTAMPTGLTGCAQEPSPFNPRLAQQWERAQDGQTPAAPMYPLPTTQESTYLPDENEPRPKPPGDDNVPLGPAVKMSLQEIVHRAIINSLDIRVAGYDTAIDQTRVMEAQAKFDPAVFANVNYEQVNKQSPGTFSTFDPVFNDGPPPNNPAGTRRIANFNRSDTTTLQFGVQQDTPSGAQIKIQEQLQNLWTRPQQTPLNPFYENELVLTVTQPLLQNFGVAVNEARITISRNNQRVSLLDFRKTVEDSVLQIEKTYGQLIQAQRDVLSLERLVAASEDTTGVLFRRKQQDVSAVQIQQANAATATRRATLVRARSQIPKLSDQLKRLMNDPDFPVSGSLVIMPADDQTELPLHFYLDEQIETGLENRLELGQQQVRIDSAEIAMHVAKNNLLPQLNFQGSFTADGVGKGLGSAFAQEGEFSHLGFAAGFQFQYPLGNRAARAIWQRALLQRQQAIDSYRNLIEQVSQEVKDASIELDTSWKEMSATRIARIAAADTLVRFQQQQDAGAQPFTPEFVQLRLDYQERFAAAEQAEHQAIFNYNFAIATLEKAKGTILRYNNVMLEEEQLPFDMMSNSSHMHPPIRRAAPNAAAAAPAAIAVPAPRSSTSK